MTNEELRIWAIEVAVEAGARGSIAVVDAAGEIVAFVRSRQGHGHDGEVGGNPDDDLPPVSRWRIIGNKLIVVAGGPASAIPLGALKAAMVRAGETA